MENIDAVIVPVGGGGLMSGVVTVIKETNPNIRVIGVEPDSAKVTYLSLQNQTITSFPADTIADGLRTSQPGDLTFPVLMKYLNKLVLVSEDEIRLAFTSVMEQVIEPSDATTIATMIFNIINMQGENVVIVLLKVVSTFII